MGKPENEITRAIIRDLKSMGCFAWKHWGGPMSKRGVPDILGVLPDGRFLGVEVKTEKGRVSEYQDRFIQDINRNGGMAFVARSVGDVRAALAKINVKPSQRGLFE